MNSGDFSFVERRCVFSFGLPFGVADADTNLGKVAKNRAGVSKPGY